MLVITKIRSFVAGIAELSGKYPLTALGVFLSLVILGFYIIINNGNVNRADYNRRKAENNKVVQSALAEADKYKKLSSEYAEKSAAIEEAAKERAAVQNKKDVSLDTKVDLINQKGEQSSYEIEQNFRNDVDFVNSMSDAERERDICTRIERLAAINPELKTYECSVSP